MKRKTFLLFISLAVATLALLTFLADKKENLPSSSTIKASPGFNLVFKYGIGAKNVLDTFKGTFTKDMIVDPPIVIKLSLKKDELSQIYQKMVQIDFFDYPNSFVVQTESMVIPYLSYYFQVTYNHKIKELTWDDTSGITMFNDDTAIPNTQAKKLQELIKLIQSIIESKEVYKALPEPTGGYL